jgi:PAS domain S-box-containing protein
LATGINKMLDEIQEKSAQLNSINDNLPESIVYQCAIDQDEKSTYLYLSKVIEKYVGKTVTVAIQDANLFTDLIHKDDRERYFAARKLAILNSTDFNIEVRIITYKEELRWMKVSAIPRKLEQSIIIWDGVFTDITKQKQTEEALRKSEEYFRSFVENANDTVFSITTEGILIYGSPNWTRVLGFDVKDFIGKSVFETIVHPDDVFLCITRIQNALMTGARQFDIEFRALHKDGSWKWQTTNAAPVFDEQGNITSFIGMARDITQQKLAEEAMQNSARSYFDLFNTITEAIYIQDGDGVFLDINVGLEKMYGYQREEIIGKTPEFLSAEGKNDFAKIQQYVSETFNEGKSQQFEFWGKRKNGEIFPKDVICNKGRYFGKDVIITTARDVTQHKLAEDALKESEEKFSKVFHLSPDVMLISRISDGVIVDVNERAFALSGYQRSEALGMTTMQLNGWADVEERNRYISMLNTKGRVANFEKLLTTRSGEIKHTTISGEVIELRGEKFIFTVIHDISDRIKAEAEIKERAKQLQTLGDNLPDTIMYQLVRDLKGDIKFTYLSKGIGKITGTSVDAVIENPDILFSLTMHEDRIALEKAEVISYENMSELNIDIRIMCYTGILKWYHISSLPRQLPDGRVLWDGVQTDITEKKLAAEKI